MVSDRPQVLDEEDVQWLVAMYHGCHGNRMKTLLLLLSMVCQIISHFKKKTFTEDGPLWNPCHVEWCKIEEEGESVVLHVLAIRPVEVASLTVRTDWWSITYSISIRHSNTNLPWFSNCAYKIRAEHHFKAGCDWDSVMIINEVFYE